VSELGVERIDLSGWPAWVADGLATIIRTEKAVEASYRKKT